MVARFNNRGFAVVALSGELTQNERAHALQAMRDGRARVCIATDVAARGIDLPNLELVIHAQLPTNPEILVHRSGRTGRAGRKGVSVMIVDHKARKRAERLLRDAKLSATWAAPPSADEVRQRDEERMLADPALSEPARDNEQAFIARLLADHAPAQLAAAFMRLYQAGQSAPEELEDSTGALADMLATGRPDRASTKQRRDDFGPSIWMSLSVGRNQNAEPRWLIPLLCNAGNITKNEIGLIKMQNDETFVQLKADHADGFFAILGPNPTLDKGIRAKRLESAPSFNSDSGGRSDSRRKPEFRDKKPHRGKSGDGEQKFHKPRKPRAEQEDRRPSDAKRSGSITKSFGERSENPLGKKKHEGRKAGAPSFEDREKPKPAKKGPPRGKSKGKDAGKPGVHYKKSRGSDLANPAKRVSRPKRPAS
jgi:ATP-dependent RNA helicase DeaD